METISRRFALSERGTTLGTEVRAGVATFLTMAYILAVNPQILSAAGMPRGDVVAATAIASALACFVMGVFADYPFALAPGMGLNAYFAYSVVGGTGFGWEAALAAVFVAGIVFVVLSVSGLRRLLLEAMPEPVKLSTMTGIGLFLAFIGFQSAGLVVVDPATLVGLGSFDRPEPLLALVGLLAMAVLVVLRVPGALLLGIGAITAVAWLFGLTPGPSSLATWPRFPKETFLAFDFSSLLSPAAVSVVVAFLFVDLFDTAGTLIGVGRLGGFTDERGDLPRADRAFLADAVGTVAGAALGTSPVTTYIESATGIEEGGKTGVTAIVTGLLFLVALVATPIFVAVPAAATAPALVLVGAFMMQGAREVTWDRLDHAIPAFLTTAVMPFTFSIAHGISAGLVSWVAIQAGRGRWREIHPVLYFVVALLLVLYGGIFASS